MQMNETYSIIPVSYERKTHHVRVLRVASNRKLSGNRSSSSFPLVVETDYQWKLLKSNIENV